MVRHLYKITTTQQDGLCRIFLSLAGMEIQFFGSTDHGLVTMPTELFLLHEACNKR